jgi:hypothetical protein
MVVQTFGMAFPTRYETEAVLTSLADGAAVLGVDLGPGDRINVGGGAHLQVDARSEDNGVLVEAYARHGVLKGAQLKRLPRTS